MIRFLADENFDNDIVRGIMRRNPEIDIVRVQDIGLIGAGDETILARAADENRVLLTHDVRTMTGFAYKRATNRLPMSGIFEVSKEVPVGLAIADIVLIAELSLDNEWEGQVRYLPLR